MDTKQEAAIKLSAEALRRIKSDPESWDQLHWHCGTSHCWAGHIDTILAEMAGSPNPGHNRLTYDVQENLGLSDYRWNRATDSRNSLEDLEYYHQAYIVDRVQFDRDGFDAEGYDADGVYWDDDGYDRNGYDRNGYNREGYNAEGKHRLRPRGMDGI